MIAVFFCNHDHIHSGVDGLRDLLFAGARNFVERVVVGDQEALEAQLLLENAGQQPRTRGAPHSIPSAIRRHDGSDTHGDGGDIAGQMGLA